MSSRASVRDNLGIIPGAHNLTVNDIGRGDGSVPDFRSDRCAFLSRCQWPRESGEREYRRASTSLLLDDLGRPWLPPRLLHHYYCCSLSLSLSLLFAPFAPFALPRRSARLAAADARLQACFYLILSSLLPPTAPCFLAIKYFLRTRGYKLFIHSHLSLLMTPSYSFALCRAPQFQSTSTFQIQYIWI
jgi:hypothetical protein